MGFSGLGSGPVLLPINEGSSLLGAVFRRSGRTFVSVRGPCGEQHDMSLVEARMLRDWLTREVPDDEADRVAHEAERLRAMRAADGGTWESA